MVRAIWQGRTIEEQKLIVTPLTDKEVAALPQWVLDSVHSVGLAVYNKVAYSIDEQTARDKLEW